VGEEKRVKLRAVGDILLGDCHLKIGTGTRSLSRSRGYDFPFEEIQAALDGEEILLVGNLECALSADRKKFRTLPFAGDIESVQALKRAGFDLLALANNHIFEYGKDAALETEGSLRSAGMQPVGLPGGSGEEAILQHAGRSLGILAFNFVRTVRHDHFQHDPSKVLDAVRSLAERTDVVILSLHWGAEFVKEPSAAQVDFGRRLIDAGARVILGHHPHTIQPVEIYQNGVIAYSLGNFVFDTTNWEYGREGIILDLEIPAKRDVAPSVAVTPIRINDNFQPVPIERKIGLQQFHDSFLPSLDFDKLLAVPEEEYRSSSWNERLRASRDMGDFLRRSFLKVPPATLWYLVRKRLKRWKGVPILTREEIEASWTLIK
jgi:poly-gamma-glutamate synthesis protein (capsule biosynthesis protein)